MNRIKVLIVDDHPMVRQGLMTFLSLNHDIEVVGEASNEEDCLLKAKVTKPDVILLDLILPGGDPSLLIKELNNLDKRSKILLLSSFAEEEIIMKVIGLGVIGYLMKDIGPNDLVNAIKSANQGIPQYHPEVTRKIIKQVSGEKSNTMIQAEKLTEREREVLTYIAKGLTNQEIAQCLHVSLKTVKSHVSNIIQKLGVTTRTQAAVYAIKENIS